MRSRKLRRISESGTAFLLTTIFLLVLLGFAALALDVGNTLMNQQRLQDAADAIALGAAQDWGMQTSTPTALENNWTILATNYFSRSTDGLIITAGVWNASTKTSDVADPVVVTSNKVPLVQVALSRVVPACFMNLFGWNTLTARAQSSAIAAQAITVTGVLPLIGSSTGLHPNACGTATITYSSGGNTAIVAMPGGQGTSWLQQNLENGYPSVISIGAVVSAETATNKVTATNQGLITRIASAPSYNCSSAISSSSRIAIVMVTTNNNLNGSSFTVTGFWVIGIDSPANGIAGKITGKFLKKYESGVTVDPSLPPVVGLNGVVLVQ